MSTSIPTDGHFFSYHHLFFPFSHSWANVGFLGIEIPRLIGIYREAGMAQIFFFTAYFLTYLVELKNVKRIRAILLVGGLLTFSTAGLFSFLGGYLVLHFYPQQRIRLNLTKVVTIFLGIPIVVGAVLFTPDFGVLAKIESTSGLERVKSYQRSLEEFSERPVFGHGYFKGFEKERAPEKVGYIDMLGLIGVIYQLGIIGVILYLLPWGYSFYHFNNSKTYFVLMPCFLTLLFSQPSFNDMLVWFLLLIDFKSIQKESPV